MNDPTTGRKIATGKDAEPFFRTGQPMESWLAERNLGDASLLKNNARAEASRAKRERDYEERKAGKAK